MIHRLVKRFVDDDVGATALEYGLLAALIAAAIVGGVTLFGENAGNTYTTLAAKVK